MTFSALATTAALLLALCPSASLAQTTDEEAEAGQPEMTEADRASRIHFESGRAHYDRGDYESAAREFETGYARQPLSAFLYNLYLTYERSGEFERAADRLEAYLDAESELEERATLEERLANLRRRAAQVEAEAETQVEAESDESESETESASESEAETEPQSHSGGGADLLVPALVSYGLGAVGLGAFAIFAALASSEDASLEEACATTVTGTGVCVAGEGDGVRTMALVADIGLGVGIAGVIAGTIFILLHDPGDEEDDAATLAPFVGPGVAGLAAAGAF